MGWLAAFGKAGTDALDRYAAQRELDRKFGIEQEQLRLQQAQDQRSAEQHKAQMQQLQDAILRGQRSDFQEKYDAGDLMGWDDEQQAKQLGLGNLLSGGHWQGTVPQRRDKSKFELDMRQGNLGVQNAEQQLALGGENLADVRKKRAGQAQYESWAAANPKASPQDHVMVAAKFGSELPEGIKLLYQQAQETARQQMYTQAMMGRTKDPYVQSRLDAAEKILAETPENFSGLLMQLQKPYAGKDVTPEQINELRRQALAMWPQMQTSRREAMTTLGQKPQAEFQGSPAYQQFMDGLYTELANQGDMDWTGIFDHVQNHPGLSLDEKGRINQLLFQLGGAVQATTPQTPLQKSIQPKKTDSPWYWPF